MRLATRAPLAILSVLVLVIAGCIGGGDRSDPPGTAGAPDGAGGPAQWQPCPEVPAEVVGDQVPAGFVDQLTDGVTYECATVAVPQDWSDPDGATFEISLLRTRTDDQRDRIGSLLVNPGGPGASGVDLAVYLSFGTEYGGLPPEVTDRFDVVGFDPRGVDRSSPVECFSDQDLDEMFAADPDPATRAELEEALSTSARMADACGQKYDQTLSLFSTHQSARDMDAIRAAVGDEQLTYLGFSYGSLLGSVYAQLFGDKVRAMVLDGAIDPTQDPVERSRAQAEGFARAFDNFVDWCGQRPQECPPGEDARAAVTDAFDQARTAPAVGADGRRATAGWVYYAVVGALYSPQTWPVLAAAIDQLDGGDPTGVFDLADSYVERSANGSYSNLWDANTAISCADRDGGQVSVSEARDLQQRWRAEWPLFGGSAALGVLGCADWPAEPDPYPTGEATGAPPILVVGTTGDPATPYESTQRLADMLGVGVVLTFDGEGHTAYPESECVAGEVNAYLVDLTVPEEGTTCD